LHLLARARAAGLYLETPPKPELVHQPVGALRPRVGEARGHLAPSRQGPDQGVVQREEDAEWGDLCRRGGGIEPGRGDRDVPRDDNLSGRGRLGRDLLGDTKEQQGRDDERENDRRRGRSGYPTWTHVIVSPLTGLPAMRKASAWRR